MTSICPGGGASEPKPGFAATVFVGPQVISALLNNIPTPWAVGMAALITSVAYELSSYCTSDPPADPGLTASDAVALLTPFHPGASNANLRFQQFVGRYLWWDLCQCVGGGTPAPPAAPSKPTGWPDVNPPGLPQSSVPCATGDHDQLTAEQWANGGTFGRFIATMVPGAAECVVTLNSAIQTGGGWDPVVTLNFRKDAGGGAHIGPDYPFTVQRTGVTVCRVPVPPGGGVLHMLWIGPGGTAAIDLVSYSTTILCTPGTGSAQGCCSDTELNDKVSHILELVQLMQRQLAPFAYVASTVHAGLTGDGEFAIQGLLGAKVALTTIPGSRGVIDGQPDELFDIGFMTFAVEDGYPHSVRIEHNPQVILPARASVFTKLAYSLTPGVVATVTELVREP